MNPLRARFGALAHRVAGRIAPTVVAPTPLASSIRTMAANAAGGVVGTVPGVPWGAQAPYRRWSGVRAAATRGASLSLTPAKIASYLRQADQGDPRAFAEMCFEMQDRDSHLVAVLGTRRRAVANLNWRLEPVSDALEDRQVAEGCMRLIRRTERLAGGMLILLDAIMTGYAGVEIDWMLDGTVVRPRRLLYRHAHHLRPDPDDPEAWRVADESDAIYGAPLVARRWILHTAQAKTGLPAQSGLGRTLAWWYLYKNYGTKDWVSYNEKFGSPLRVGKYPTSAQDDDIDALDEALRQLGVDASATIPEDMKVEFIADSGAKTGGDTFERLLVFANREISKLVLGQTLTTEEGSNGTQALGNVHNTVRADLRDSDAAELAGTLTRDLVAPMVLWNWGPNAPVPQWCFNVEPAPDKAADADLQVKRGQVFQAARTLGVPVSVAQVQEELGIRTPEPGEAVLPPAPAAPAAPSPAGFRIIAAADRATPVAQLDLVLKGFREQVADAWRAILVEVRAQLGDVTSADVLRQRLPQILGALDLAPYADPLAAASVTAEALGRLQVTGGDKGHVVLPSTSPLTDIHGWAEKVGMPSAEWGAIVARRRADSADAVRYALLRTAQDLLASLDDERLGDSPEARAQMAADQAATSVARTDGVLDSAATQTWSDGRWAVATAPTGKRLYLRYHTMEDAKVRPTHRTMQGKVYPAQHPIWLVWRPPNGYGCRCWVTVHTYDEVIAAGWEITEDFPGVLPDKGWAKGEKDATYDWSQFPAEWRAAVEAPK